MRGRFSQSQVVPFGREDLTAYEIGAKTDWLNKRLRINVSGFFNKYKDIQLTVLALRCHFTIPRARVQQRLMRVMPRSRALSWRLWRRRLMDYLSN